jgi:hypothetical protein
VFGELRALQPLQAVVESGHSEAFTFQPMPQPALGEPAQDGGPFGERREVVNLMTFFTEPADDLREVLGDNECHRGDDRPVVLALDQIQHLERALSPAWEVLEVAARGGRQHSVQAGTDGLGVAYDAASPV